MEMRISLCLVLCVFVRVCVLVLVRAGKQARESNLAVCFVCCDRACACVTPQLLIPFRLTSRSFRRYLETRFIL